jgi:hypothetical protein
MPKTGDHINNEFPDKDAGSLAGIYDSIHEMRERFEESYKEQKKSFKEARQVSLICVGLSSLSLYFIWEITRLLGLWR